MAIPLKDRRLYPSLRWSTWVQTQWLRTLFRALSLGPIMSRARAIGAENIPSQGGVILIFWHPTMRDPHNIFKVFPRNIAFMAAEFLFKGLRGWLLKQAGHIEVRRNGPDAALSLKQAAGVVRAGGALALAPEGRCTPVGQLVGDFRTGAARLALETGAPVHLALPFGTTSRRYRGLLGLITKPPVTVVFTPQLRPISEFRTAGDGSEDAIVRAYTAYLFTATLSYIHQGVPAR